MIKKILLNYVYTGADIDPLISHIHAKKETFDGICFVDSTTDDESHEQAVLAVKKLSALLGIPIFATGGLKRLEDVKKYLYAGANRVLFTEKDTSLNLIDEAILRFGADRLGMLLTDASKETPAELCTFFSTNDFTKWSQLLEQKNTLGVVVNNDLEASIVKSQKHQLLQQGLSMCIHTPTTPWNEIKLDITGLLPVVVQDERTNEVLMMAYMDQFAYEHTVATGMMTYYSRSRKQSWIKGETSGHYQYVSSLTLDCDKDTLLARVKQIGVACHTGSPTCFFNQVHKVEDSSKHSNKVIEDLIAVIEDRKINPKEGSYTNYLFDKGIDKILKKLGEEAVEIVIASKNPNPEEIKYEISDFLYHMLVLMVEKKVTWDEILEELEKR